MWLDEQPWQAMMRLQHRQAFLLRIAGIPIDWFSGAGRGASLPAQIGETLSYQGARFLIEVGDSRENVDPLGGIAETGGYDITIGFDPRHKMFSLDHGLRVGDARAWFLMKGEKAVAWHARPLQTIPLDPNVTEIEVDTSPALLVPWLEANAEAMIFIGQETITATGWDGTGVPGDPWKLVGVKRAQAGSVLQRHYVDGTVENDPIIRDRPIFHRGRRAVLYTGAMTLAGGGVAEWQEVCRGIIESEPQKRGPTIQFRVIDHLTRLRSNKVDIGGKPIQLLRSHRMMSPGKATAIELAQVWPRRAAAADGGHVSRQPR